MARIRSVHPGLFTDEAFMELTVDCPVAIPLLLGLWCDADDGGAFEWKPLMLKARYLAATAEDVAALLDRLAALGFVKRFEIAGKRVGVVRNFMKFQRPKKPHFKLAVPEECRFYAGSELGAPEGGSSSELCPQMEEEGGRREKESSSASSAGASAKPPEIDLAAARPLPTRDTLEAEARAVMGEAPVVVDADFSPISALLGEPGVTRADVLAGLTEARAAQNFRPVSWRQCAGWVRRAAKNRLGAAMLTGAGQARGPPRSAKRPQSALSVCLEIARVDDACADARNSGAEARAGPVIEGRAVAL